MGEFISHITIVDGGSDREARGKCPGGYTLVPVDLNTGARGRWIYLCYAKLDDTNPILSLALSFGRGNLPWGGPAAATRIDVDLNKGAGGDSIYLWYVRQSEADLSSTFGSRLNQFFVMGFPIRDIKVVVSDGPNASAPSGWTRVEGYDANNFSPVDPDVNRGARGKYIYLFYRRLVLMRPRS